MEERRERAPTVGQSQQDLIEIMNMVKKNEITIVEAEHMFQTWQDQYKGGKTGSFKEKQVGTHMLSVLLKGII